MKKIRLDVYLTEHGLIDSRSMAQRLIMAGEVEVNGQVYLKPSQKIDPDAAVTLKMGPKYVSRGGEKLEPALAAFDKMDLTGKICVDVGASTGGFTDCLLHHGAAHVFAVDVGYGILHWKLRQDDRVTVMEKTNARFLAGFEKKIDLVTIDASFISLKTLLPVIKKWLQPGAEVIALIKPQFEAGKKDAAKGSGVIRNSDVHRRVLSDLLNFAEGIGFDIQNVTQSALKGPKGNIEFLVHLAFSENKESLYNIEAVIQQLIPAEDDSDDVEIQ
jgi:23S rRNA (cytidine1920-2'-O)/16S rRNA (cytidine1409-2'-O)-methyltransferase